MSDGPATGGGEAARAAQAVQQVTALARQQVATQAAQQIAALVQAAEGLGWPAAGRIALPSRSAVVDAVDELRSAFFPGYVRCPDLRRDALHDFIEGAIQRGLDTLREQVRRAVAFADRHDPDRCEHCARKAADVAMALALRLSEVRRLCASDVEAAYEGDPALQNRDEAIFSYPGIFAVSCHRLAHELYELGVPLIPRMISEHAHALTGIDIHPGAAIGERFFIDHGTGVVIGETCRIGRNVRLYQGVTLGAKSFQLDVHGHPVKGVPRHPMVEDDVIVYAGATLLGRITVGRGSVVGGNVWLTSSVPPDSRITQARPQETHFEEGAGI